MNSFNLPMFIGAIGLFFLGMLQLEMALKNVSGRRMREFLKRNTGGRTRSILSGAFVTAILQSSSLVSLIVLTFIGSGLIALESGIGIIIGANLGTTLSGWLFTLVGFKLNIKDIAYYGLGISSLFYFIFPDKSRTKEVARLVLGLSLLFVGLDSMKEAMSTLGNQFDINLFKGHSNLIYFAIGFILTAIIQSSSACMVIVLSALHNQLIPFETGAAMVLGADLGTTLTVFLGAINGSPDKKRLATAHFTYNLIVDVIVLIGLPLFILFIREGLGIEDPLIGLVTFHSSFNLLGIFIFFPFIQVFTTWLLTLFKEEEPYLTRCRPSSEPLITGPALDLLEEETRRLLDRVHNFNRQMFNHPSHYQKFALAHNEEARSFTENYHSLKIWEAELFEYGVSLKKDVLEPEEKKRYHRLQNSQKNFIYAAKGIKDVHQNLVSFFVNDGEDLVNLFMELKLHYQKFLVRIFDLYGEGHGKISSESFEQLKNENMELNSHLSDLYEQGQWTKKLSKTDISSFFNLVAAIYTSNMALIRGLEELCSDEE